MLRFFPEDQFCRHSNDVSYVAGKADEFIRNLHVQLETVKAAAAAASITAEKTCSLLEQKFLSLSSDFSRLESQNAQLQSSLAERLSNLAVVQAQKLQLHVQSIGKDEEIERLALEVSEMQKSKRQLVELMEQKDLEISQKSSSISNYLDRIVNLTDNAAQKEARISEIEAELARCQANCARLSQYKSIAQLNEAALKHMEVAHHENFKMESEKIKESLEDQLRLLRDRISELENQIKLKSEKLAGTTAGKEYALASSLMEIVSLKDESSSKISKIMALETQVSALETQVSEKEHKIWRYAQDNYERQVVLHSETIKELTKTSEALAALQRQASDLRKWADEQKTENEELKAKYETEKLFLEESKKEVERKYTELNEQNKILHNRLEALHILLAEDDGTAPGVSSSVTLPDSGSDTGLQNVISYLGRTKDTAPCA